MGCVNNYCTIQSIQSAVQLTTVESCQFRRARRRRPMRAGVWISSAAPRIQRVHRVSFGFEADMSSSWSVLEDGLTEHCNPNPVTISNDAAGILIRDSPCREMYARFSTSGPA